MRGINNAFANRVANPVVTNLDVFRALVHRVVEIDQRYRALVVDSEVDRVVNDEADLLQKRSQPRNGFTGVYGRNVFSLGSRERDGGLLSRAPGKASAVDPAVVTTINGKTLARVSPHDTELRARMRQKADGYFWASDYDGFCVRIQG